ncbi:hypothetical protein SIN8267_03201 [Sinobacterium norvegicum]|uniref:Cytochrome c domain-containing protein n=1 Tax=Sinobacterium norvegicum TaxID=1641715 RepID=A0ABN8EL44_9GAMM|nr:hypothetical protein [Sinobacterium norvegicum]CAH0993062.1 hypothetical protein SIN8267_03201 [Sinobacterium norvegicum]
MLKKTPVLLAVSALLSWNTAHADVLPGYQSYNGFTNDVGPDLATVIEWDVTKPACDQYQADLDQYLIDNADVLSGISDEEASLADLSDREIYIIDNFVDTYDRQTLLSCGKYQYFYGHFDTTGAPQVMVDWMLQYFDDFMGPGMSNFGMYEDPNAVATIPAPASNPEIGTRQLPVGIAHSSGDFGNAADPADAIKVYSFTCSSCHFKQMDDGNFAVGIASTDFDYARMTAAQGQLPLSTLLGIPGEAHDPDGLMASVAQAVADSNAKYGQDVAKNAFLNDVNAVILAGSVPEDLASIQSTPEEQLVNWATWPGVQDFLVRPMQDDGVHAMTRMMNNGAIPTDPNVLKQFGFNEQQGLGWNGGGYSLIQFIRGFITMTVSDPDTPESRDEYNYWVKEYRYLPLVRYLESIDEPSLPTDRSFDTAAAKRGEAIFDSNCTSCHNGPGGETSRPYAHAEVNVEAEHANIYNPVWDPDAFDGAGGWENGIALIAERFPAGVTGEVTRKVKAPRFISLWDDRTYLHNGSIDSLESLLGCAADRTSYATVIPTAENPNPTMEEHLAANPIFSNKGHEFGCSFSAEDRADLITFLQTFKTNRNEGNKYNGQFDSVCHVRNNGTSYQLNLTFRHGNNMALMTKHFSDGQCADFDTSLVNNPSVALNWDMQVNDTFINSRGYESHNVTYTHPDGTVDQDTIALEDGQLANAVEGDPEPRGLFVRHRTDYPGLNGLWLNDECRVDNARGMVVIQDGVRVDKSVSYSGADCSGDVLSVVNVDSWTFEDPEWTLVGTHDTYSISAPKYNMHLKMKSTDATGNWTQFANVTDNTLHLMFNNYFAASINGNGEHYTRISDILTAQ